METQYDYYDVTKQMTELYDLLQDEKSKRIFWGRLTMDIDQTYIINDTAVNYSGQSKKQMESDEKQTLERILNPVNMLDIPEQTKKLLDMMPEQIQMLREQKKKVILYGTSAVGTCFGEALCRLSVEFDGFCGRRALEIKELQGKPVYTPKWLFEHADECYVYITAGWSSDSILKDLKENCFPEDHVLGIFDNGALNTEGQYFEFPELLRAGGAFVDAGCFDAQTSFDFVKWCGGKYTKIFAFEPDPVNAEHCCENVQKKGLRDFALTQAGLSEQQGTLLFAGCGSGRSCVISESVWITEEQSQKDDTATMVPVVALDEIVKETKVSFIKMDIEGSELSALKGAKNTIHRDKPLCAICVYHKPGDALAIMDYLHTIVPEYRFWLRHYQCGGGETILYAAIP